MESGTPISDRIAEYERSTPDHRSGTVDVDVLRSVERLAGHALGVTLETGCGKSTVLLSQLSTRHYVFTVDDSIEEGSSVRYFQGAPGFRPESTHCIFGPTQRTLPAFVFAHQLDLAFLDGPHGYPFPELEYYFIYPHLKSGAWLVVDDIHIPTLNRFFEFLREERMFDLVEITRTTAIFRRNTTPTFSPIEDGWWLQAFNAARFPVDVSGSALVPRGAQALLEARESVNRLTTDVQRLAGDVAWWQHVAEERRLKRRLVRRLSALRDLVRGTTSAR